MKFNVNQQDLQKSLNYCQGVIEKRSTLPILSNVLLDVSNSKLTITATDLADYLVKNHEMPFRKAYQVTASVVNYAEKKKKKLHELNINELNKIEPKLTKDVLKIFDLKYSVNSKKSLWWNIF